MRASHLSVGSVASASLVLLVAASCNLARPADVLPSDTLVSLSATHGVFDPAFAPEVLEYDLDLVVDEADTALTPLAAVPDGTTITLDGNPLDSGTASPALALTVGESRDVHVVVTRGGGDVRTYVLHVHRGVDGLASLVPSKGTLAPAFDPAINAYVDGLHLAEGSAAVTPTLLFPTRAAVTVNDADVASGTASTDLALAPGSNAVAVTVTSRTRTARTYDVEVVRGTDALGSIRLSFAGGLLPNAFDPVFDPATTSYTVNVGLWLTQASVAATPFISGSTVTVAGDPVPAGTESSPTPLNVGQTQLPVVVTSPDGAKTTYLVKIVRAGPVVQQAYVKASNHPLDFGSGLAISGDTMVVGAVGESSAATGIDGDQNDTSASGAGAAYVFTRSGDKWTQQAYLKASNTGAGDVFGQAVAIWGDTIAVGAWNEASSATGINGDQSDNSTFRAGAVYVFRRTGSTWAQEAYIKAPYVQASGRFGNAVALWGDTLAVFGFKSADGGVVHVYTRSGSTWSLQDSIRGSNEERNDEFGGAIALWGDTLVVGAVDESSAATGVDGDQADNTAPDAGAAYVFTRSGTTWSQQAYLKASNTDSLDLFGSAVAISSDTIVVGATYEASASKDVDSGQADNTTTGAGAAYVFVRQGSTWSQQGYLKAPNTDAQDFFGGSVAVWGDTVIVGALGEASASTGLDGDQSSNALGQAGAAYVYQRSFNSFLHKFQWSPVNYVKASTTDTFDWFGYHVALWGDTCAIGAYEESSAATGVGGDQADNSVPGAGAVYVLR